MAPPRSINTNVTASDPQSQAQTHRPRLDIPAPRLVVRSQEKSFGSNGTPSYVVLSGGTGCNAICAAFAQACYVLPVSDDGGSSSEIIRVLGGPSIGCSCLSPTRQSEWQTPLPTGDIRSRLVRLIPPAPPGTTSDALRILLAHRLPSGIDGEQTAREEWRSIVEGKSSLWGGIPEDRKETIRGTTPGQLVCSSTCSRVVTFQVFWYTSRARFFGARIRTFHS
jgi:hypothetical protein